MRLATLFLMLSTLFPIAFSGAPATPAAPAKSQILWDTWGVPHIFASNDRELFHAFGWSQAESHGDSILRMYGQSRGKAAEYWGESFVESDRWVVTNGIPARAEKWLAAQQPDFRRNLEAFAAGINDYAKAHPDAIAPDRRIVLPVTALDVIAHAQRVIHFSFVTRQSRVVDYVQKWKAAPSTVASAALPAFAEPVAGSNTWALAPSRTASGKAMLLENPHLPWEDLFRHTEAHLSSPSGNLYGTALVGFPVLVQVFTDDIGWAHTVNAYDGADYFALTLRPGGYLWDGAVKPFEVETKVLRVRQPNGTFREERIDVRRSVHGPVIGERPGQALALRVAGLDRPESLREWWDLAHAHNLREFDATLSTLQIPMFTVMYADRQGHILHQYNGVVPARAAGNYDWTNVVPGDIAKTLWTTALPYSELPRVLDPPSGWMQNSNDPPWVTTLPRQLDPANFPKYLAPVVMSPRPQRGAEMLSKSDHATLDSFVHDKFSTRMGLADRWMDDLLAAVAASSNADAKRAAVVLAAWDRCADNASRGAVLFERFARAWNERTHGKMFRVPWTLDRPLETPIGLADPRAAVDTLGAVVAGMDKEKLALDVPWGTVYRFQGGDIDLPGNGAPGDYGVFRVVDYAAAKNGTHAARGGDSYFAAIDFTAPLQARVLTAPGNSTQPSSKHQYDQLPLMSRKEMRPVWRTRAEVEKHLESRETISSIQ